MARPKEYSLTPRTSAAAGRQVLVVASGVEEVRF